jgi:hypothetical protein
MEDWKIGSRMYPSAMEGGNRVNLRQFFLQAGMGFMQRWLHAKMASGKDGEQVAQ